MQDTKPTTEALSFASLRRKHFPKGKRAELRLVDIEPALRSKYRPAMIAVAYVIGLVGVGTALGAAIVLTIQRACHFTV